MKNIFKILFLLVAYCFICTNIIANTNPTDTDPLLIEKQPSGVPAPSPNPDNQSWKCCDCLVVDLQPGIIKGALAYDPDSACTACCGGLSMCCFRQRDGSQMEVIRGKWEDYMNAMTYNMQHSQCVYRAGWAIRGCLEPACYGVPNPCKRSQGVLCSMGGCDQVPDEYDYALELVWHYFAAPTYSWKRAWQCWAGLGIAADIIAASGGGAHASAAIALPSILGLPLAVMGLSCLTPRLCPKLDYLCYSNSCMQCTGYAASCLPWAVAIGLGTGL